MHIQRQIDDDDRIRRGEARFDQIERPPTVDDPAIPGQNVVVLAFDFIVGSRGPTRFPLNLVDGEERQLPRLAQPAAESRFAAACISNDNNTGHSIALRQFRRNVIRPGADRLPVARVAGRQAMQGAGRQSAKQIVGEAQRGRVVLTAE